jgi:hypothetical protein
MPQSNRPANQLNNLIVVLLSMFSAFVWEVRPSMPGVSTGWACVEITRRFGSLVHQRVQAPRTQPNGADRKVGPVRPYSTQASADCCI